MTTKSGPIYEATFFVEHEVVAEFDLWLEGHVREILSLATIVDCRAFPTANETDGNVQRVCQYVLEDDAPLDEFLAQAGADMEVDVASRFGEQVSVSNRVFRVDESFEAPVGKLTDCLNCGTRLRGQYCGNCGQRSRSRLISLWELISDAFGDLFELDSRLWQTLVPLMTRPGRLTHDYLQGRRARYMPPFRMYLVMSLVFFVVAFFDPREELGLLFAEPAPGPGAAIEDGANSADETSEAGETGETGETAPAEAELSESDRVKQDILDDLAEEGIIVSGGFSEGDGSPRITVGDQEFEDAEDCDIDASILEDLPDWLARRLTVERMNHVCERVQFDDGRSLAKSMLDNIPAALIILLPLMALVLKVLYPLSRRYYVEHLLFFVHFHAFFFLILTLQVLFARLGPLARLPEAVVAVTLVATSFYVPVYLFVAMRRVYGQGRFVTFLKYVGLTVAYIGGFVVTMMGALAIAAFSI